MPLVNSLNSHGKIQTDLKKLHREVHSLLLSLQAHHLRAQLFQRQYHPFPVTKLTQSTDSLTVALRRIAIATTVLKVSDFGGGSSSFVVPNMAYLPPFSLLHFVPFPFPLPTLRP